MENSSPEICKLISALEANKRLVAMLAPSFPVDFSYPEIVGKLKRLGFTYVVEVARGAMETNRELLKCLQKNPKARFITSPCPAIVRLIRNKYPELVKFLAPVDSPMCQTAKLIQQNFPGLKPVFIGPCSPKKAEATQDHPELGILVLTYKELKEIFAIKHIKEDSSDFMASFDMTGPETRLYPISGGLAQSAALNNFLTDQELDVISGPKLVEKALKGFLRNRLRVLDILFCDGGCIAGAGITSSLPTLKRREKVITHWASATMK